uniref:A-kinase anchor protein 2 C-terminal domain-containing protein n=1 Tax=Lepisosteus oculatus TaxID=7918 RepID=W5MNM2_LEPOC
LSGTAPSVNLEPKGPSLTEGAVGKVIILENTIRIPATLLRAAPVANDPARSHEGERAPVLDSRGMPYAPQGEEEPDGEVLLEDEPPRENPFFKLRSSMSLKPEVEQDIREAQQRERELRRQRFSLYGTAGGPRDSEEPQPATPNGLAIPSTPPPNRPVSPSPSPSPAPSARQSLGKLDVTWPPPCRPAAEPSGHTEEFPDVKGSPKTPRQKIPLLQRWETGMVNGHQEED